MKLPDYLKRFILCLACNDLGINKEDMYWLGEGLKQLPNNLENL